ncbi:hypothetical protein SAMN04487995_4639 [Dyadobacter koreensis]|uniref:Uncharacterized protein n=1 Tax=Dyadobacter koreensis TaxID=408657 RepID=A0A1H6YYK0_9BACT|nr:hypothetical protein [Dyadobacter koreensis]SEJ42462.1 hypothetical protein SAMN04487995_4639 [Dyadobacter koreensis]
MKVSSPEAIFFAVLSSIVIIFFISYPIMGFGDPANYSFAYFMAWFQDFQYFWTCGFLILGAFFYIFYKINIPGADEGDFSNILINRPFVTVDVDAPDLFKIKNIGTAPAINGGYRFFYKNRWSEIQNTCSVMQGEEFVFVTANKAEFTGFEYNDLDGNIYSSVSHFFEPDSIYKSTYFFDCGLEKINRRALNRRMNVKPFGLRKKAKKFFVATKIFKQAI